MTVDQTRTLVLTVKNTGLGLLHGNVDTSMLAPFVATSGAVPFTLADGKLRRVKVKFAPKMANAFTGKITITSDDPSNKSVTVTVSGMGV